jgi:hypothetical protein
VVYPVPTNAKEYVIRKLCPVEHVIYAENDRDAELKARAMLEKDEVLVGVLSRIKFEYGQVNGSTWK